MNRLRWTVTTFAVTLTLLAFVQVPAQNALAKTTDPRGFVQVDRDLPNGQRLTRVYTTAPGTSAYQLATRVGGKVVAPGFKRSSLSCAYGTARTQGCPGIYWARQGHPTAPQVHYVDQAGPQWRVWDAAVSQNRVSGVDSHAVDVCPTGRTYAVHCVDVLSADYGATGWSGVTSWSATQTSFGWRLSWAQIKLNDHYPLWGVQGQQVSCHELGHSIGLGHAAPGASSCMDNPYHSELSYDDRELMRRTYLRTAKDLSP